MAKKTLLLADDSVTIQKVVNLTFADEGIEVITVGDGDSAMQKISEIAPDVVLADVHMPGLSGYQICEIVRENPATRDLPVVLLVGSFEPFDESEAARVGANAYLTKPFQSIRQLVNQVTDLMQGSSPEAAAPEVTEPPVVEAPPSEKIPDTTDIDSLYHQSVAETSPASYESASTESAEPQYESAYTEPSYEDTSVEPATGTPSYVDAGMDDEMIETSHVGGPADDQIQSDFEAQVEAPDSYAADFPVETQHSEYVENTQDYTTGELTPVETPFSSEAPASIESVSFEAEPETGWAPADQPVSAGAFDSLAEDRMEVSDETPTVETPHQDFDEFSRTEQIPSSISQSAFNLDDLELLDLPPIENGKTQEFTATQRSAEEGGGKEIVTLSPELMDILVQRVVDKLSKDK